MLLPFLLIQLSDVFLRHHSSARRLTANLIHLIEPPSDLVRPSPAHDFVPNFVILTFNHYRPVTCRIKHPLRFCLHLLEFFKMVAAMGLVCLVRSFRQRLSFVEVKTPLSTIRLWNVRRHFLHCLALGVCLQRLHRFDRGSFLFSCGICNPGIWNVSHYLLNVSVEHCAFLEILKFVVTRRLLLHYFLLFFVICCLLD